MELRPDSNRLIDLEVSQATWLLFKVRRAPASRLCRWGDSTACRQSSQSHRSEASLGRAELALQEPAADRRSLVAALGPWEAGRPQPRSYRASCPLELLRALFLGTEASGRSSWRKFGPTVAHIPRCLRRLS